MKEDEQIPNVFTNEQLLKLLKEAVDTAPNQDLKEKMEKEIQKIIADKKDD